MENKCTKFEALFTFASEEEFLEHLKSCKDCQEEFQKMQKVSELIQTVKPYFLNKYQVLHKLKVACIILFLAFGGLSIGIASLYTDITDTIKYGTTLSSEDLGFPVDSYGLIAVE